MAKSPSIEIDDTKLFQLVDSLSPKILKKSVMPAVRRTASKAQSIALEHLKGTGIRNASKMRVNLRKRVSDRPGMGLRMNVTLRTTKKSKSYVNRYGQQKPVPLFLAGSKEKPRSTKGENRKPHGTGVFRKNDFLKASDPQIKEMLAKEWPNELKKSVIRTAQKYGCS